MSDTKAMAMEDIKLSSTVFPTGEDIALWQSLSDDQRRAIIERDEQAALDSGIADKASLHEILTETRAENERGL